MIVVLYGIIASQWISGAISLSVVFHILVLFYHTTCKEVVDLGMQVYRCNVPWYTHLPGIIDQINPTHHSMLHEHRICM